MGHSLYTFSENHSKCLNRFNYHVTGHLSRDHTRHFASFSFFIPDALASKRARAARKKQTSAYVSALSVLCRLILPKFNRLSFRDKKYKNGKKNGRKGTI